MQSIENVHQPKGLTAIVVFVIRATFFVLGIEVVIRAGGVVSLPIERIPIITTLALAATAPQLRATYPRAVIGGHLIALSLSLFCHVWLIPAVIVAAMALVAMQVTATVHPPAALTPFLLAAHPDLGQPVVLPLFFGCLVAVIVSGLLRRVTT